MMAKKRELKKLSFPSHEVDAWLNRFYQTWLVAIAARHDLHQTDDPFRRDELSLLQIRDFDGLAARLVRLLCHMHQYIGTGTPAMSTMIGYTVEYDTLWFHRADRWNILGISPKTRKGLEADGNVHDFQRRSYTAKAFDLFNSRRQFIRLAADLADSSMFVTWVVNGAVDLAERLSPSIQAIARKELRQDSLVVRDASVPVAGIANGIVWIALRDEPTIRSFARRFDRTDEGAPLGDVLRALSAEERAILCCPDALHYGRQRTRGDQWERKLGELRKDRQRRHELVILQAIASLTYIRAPVLERVVLEYFCATTATAQDFREALRALQAVGWVSSNHSELQRENDLDDIDDRALLTIDADAARPLYECITQDGYPLSWFLDEFLTWIMGRGSISLRLFRPLILGVTHIYSRHPSRRLEHYEALLRAIPCERDERVDLAVELASYGHFSIALEVVRQLTNARPERVDAWSRLLYYVEKPDAKNEVWLHCVTAARERTDILRERMRRRERNLGDFRFGYDFARSVFAVCSRSEDAVLSLLGSAFSEPSHQLWLILIAGAMPTPFVELVEEVLDLVVPERLPSFDRKYYSQLRTRVKAVKREPWYQRNA
jgi:hypothetical protein